MRTRKDAITLIELISHKLSERSKAASLLHTALYPLRGMTDYTPNTIRQQNA